MALAAVVVYRWRTKGFDVSAFASTFQGVSIGWLAMALILSLLTYAGRALRWEVMLRPLSPNARVWDILTATVIGFTAIVFLGRPGEVVRPYLISVKQGVSFSSQMAAWVLERILDLMMVLVILGIALAEISHSNLKPGPNVQRFLQLGGVIILVAGALCLSFLLLFRNFSDLMQRLAIKAIGILPLAVRPKLESFVSAFVEGLKATQSNVFLMLLVAYSVLEWVIIIGCFISIFRAFPVTAHLTLTEIVIFMGLVMFGAAVQIPGVGGGLQVATVLVLTELFKFKFETATSFALMLWAITFVFVTPFGLTLAFREGLKWSSFKEIGKEKAA